MSKWITIPKDWLGPISQVVALVRKHGSLPKAIAAIISTYIVSSVLNLGGYIVGSIVSVFDLFTGSLRMARMAIGGSSGAVGITILRGVREVWFAYINAVSVAGPLAPIIVIGTTSVVLYGVYRLLIAIIGSLPVVSGAIDLLGLR